MRRLLTVILPDDDPVRSGVVNVGVGGEAGITRVGLGIEDWEGVSVREATPEDLTAAFVAQCQEDGRADDLDAAFDLKYARYFDQSGQRKVARKVLRRLGLSALLEDGSEEGELCEG